jgi:hypothetical protein
MICGAKLVKLFHIRKRGTKKDKHFCRQGEKLDCRVERLPGADQTLSVEGG